MTEREKMLAGQSYNCGDAELLARWHQAKDLTRDLFLLNSADLAEKQRIYDALLGGYENPLWITPPFYVDYGWNIHLGENCEINMGCTFLDAGKITIGSHALIAPNVQIYTAYHPAQAAKRQAAPPAGQEDSFAFCATLAAPVTVEDHVWLGGGAILLPGITVGSHSVIGAGSVVTRDIPPYSVACGNPCRVLRKNI